MATLPEAPQGLWLEDAVAAALQCGAYIERNVHDNAEGADSLELDVIATTYENRVSQKLLVEVKSGGWGFGEVFKLAGWMQYLGIERAAFFSTTVLKESKQARITAIGGSLNISVLPCAVFSHDALLTALQTSNCLNASAASDAHVSLWRFVFWIERILIAELRKLRDSGSPCAEQAIDYHNVINDKIFFTKPGWQSAERLYAAFQDNDSLSIDASNEIDPTNPRTVREAAMQRGEYPLLQAIFAIQYRSRVAMLKTAVDVILASTSPSNLGVQLGLFGLPASFRSATTELRKHKYVHLYPHFWQTFLWGWGGFIVNDFKETEFEQLAAETAIPVSEIPNALAAMDILFPTPKTWFRPLMGDVNAVILFPAVFRGVGALRRLANADKEWYDALNLRRPVSKMLSDWHNSSARLIESAEGPLAAISA